MPHSSDPRRDVPRRLLLKVAVLVPFIGVLAGMIPATAGPAVAFVILRGWLVIAIAIADALAIRRYRGLHPGGWAPPLALLRCAPTASVIMLPGHRGGDRRHRVSYAG